jgi:lipopolysaccharide transport system ATP-binding protein
MYVRLAFAVAAHLEPEILVVDEVLAVGDAEFQKKCLGKMDEVSRGEGRTVLFVSHNMEAVLKLCTRCILLDKGSILAIDETSAVVSAYLRTAFSSPAEISLASQPRQSGLPKSLRLSRASVVAPREDWSIPFGEPLSFDLWIDSRVATNYAELGIGLFSRRGYEIVSWTSACSGVDLSTRPGLNVFRIEYEDLVLLPGQYFLGIGIRSTEGGAFEDYLPEAILFEIRTSSRSAEINGRTFGGSVVPRVRLSTVQDIVASGALADLEGRVG